MSDCTVRGFADNLVVTSADRADPNDVSRDIVFRDCRILDAWSTTWPYAGQGLYLESADGVTVDGCLFDRNG